MTNERTVPVPPSPPPAPSSLLLERREQELSFLAEITRALANTDDLEELLPLLLKRLCTLSRCEAAAVLGVAGGGDLVVLATGSTARTGADPLRGRTFARSGTLLDRALCDRAPVPVRAEASDAGDPIVYALSSGLRPGHGMIVPLCAASGAAHGGLVVLDRPEPFRPDDLRLLMALADQAAIAVARADHARDRAAEATRLRVLSAVLHVTSSGFEEEILLRNAMESLLEAWSVDGVELATRDGGELRYHYTYPKSVTARSRETDRRHRTLHQRAVEIGRATVPRADARTGTAVGGSVPELRAACVPLRTRDRSLGSLLIARRTAAFDDNDLELLTAIGDHLGITIELSRLFRRVALEADQLERVVAERSATLQQTQEQLARSQWLASLGELAAGVAHDLNNALNPIVAFAELIKEHGEQPDKVRTYAERILLAAQGGAETVRRIQRFTRHRLGTLPSEVIALASLVQEAVELTRPTWTRRTRGAGIDLIEAVDPGLMVQGNPGELRQALINLITNALDAMPAGGTLRFVGRGEGESVVLAVQDTGAGMSSQVKERALEPFYTTKGVHGTGLGLPEVFGIVRRHGGHLELESWPGIGTTVLLHLAGNPAVPLPVKAQRPGRHPAASPFRILLVDDNMLSLEAMAASLRAAGHSVTTAVNAQTALRLFGAGRYDVVLSDLGLPDLSGWELVDQLRVFDPAVRVGVITGWSLPDEDEELTRRGIDLVFVKPVDPDELLAAL